MTAIFHNMVEDFMEVFKDDFSVFGNSFNYCLANLDRMLASIEVDRAKIDVIAKLPYPTNVKGVRSFLGHAGFYQRFIKDFSMISKPMTQLLMKVAKFDFSDDCKKALNILKEKLNTAPIIISPDWNVTFELMCDASDFAVGADKKEAENLVADHLSRLENPILGVFTEEEITDEFPDEHLMILKSELNDDEPWYSIYVNYIVGKIVPPKWTPERRRSASITGRKVYESGFFWPSIFKDAKDYILRCDACQRSGNISSRSEMPQKNIQIEAQALPTNDARVMIKFLRGLFARFGVPKALISDRETYFCNFQLEKALRKYGVTHKLSTAYHPQTNGHTEVTNRVI
ncbi:reverse transcriptase domain-containing protein [Tanacetum coccineum]